MPGTSAKAEAKYVYGVVPATTAGRLDGEGLRGCPLDAVQLDDIAAVTSDVPDQSFEAGREELMAHAGALERAFEHGTVLPMRFGIVMESASSVREDLLAAHREELQAQLEEMKGKVEVNLKGFYDEATVLREIVAEEPEAAQLKETIATLPEDATYPQRIRLGELVAEALQVKRERDAELIHSRLAPHALEVDSGDPVHERMAVNWSFLLDRGALEKFDRALDELASQQQGRIRFKYVGPVPPHSFVELALEE